MDQGATGTLEVRPDEPVEQLELVQVADEQVVRHVVQVGRVLGGLAVRLDDPLIDLVERAEAIAAREAGLQVLGISLVTNAAAGVSSAPLDHHEVIEAGRAAGPKLAALLASIVGVL